MKKAWLAFAFCAAMLDPAYGQGPAGPGGVPTYNSDVAPLLAGNCMQCHRPGQVAASLMRYEDARQLAKSIKDRVVDKSMPPWHADSKYGVFANERVLNEEQIKTIVSWADAGTPRGDPRQTPLLPEFSSGWPLGQPDVVVPILEEFTIPAGSPGGPDLHATFEVFTTLPDDVWVVAAEINSNPRVARGATVLMEKERLVGGIPGAMYEVFPANSAKLLKAGSKLVISMHYRPAAETQKDRVSIGLMLAKGPVVWQIHSRALDGKTPFVFPVDAELIEIMPRMGAAKDVTYSAAFPNNRAEILLLVPTFDPNWQTTYELAQPAPMPRGTRINMTATVENGGAIEGWFDYRVRR